MAKVGLNSREIRLDKSRTRVDVDLAQERVAGVNEPMRRVRRYNDNATRSYFALVVSHGDGSAALNSECDFDVGMFV